MSNQSSSFLDNSHPDSIVNMDNSKYKEAEDSENPRTVAFREKIEELIENFDELAKAS